MRTWRLLKLAAALPVALCLAPSAAGSLSGAIVAGGSGESRRAELRAISSRLDGTSSTIVIEASEPVAYVTSRPDPHTVLVDLRNVDPGLLAHPVGPLPPITGVRVDEHRAPDGASVARVSVTLDREAPYRVRSSRNLIFVEVERTAAPGPEADMLRLKPLPAELTGGVEGQGSAAQRPAVSGSTTQLPEGRDSTTQVATGAGAPPHTPEGPGVGPGTAAAGMAAAAPPGVQNPVQPPPPPPPAPPAQPAPRFTGHRISIDFQGADLRSVLRTFAEISGLNVVIDSTIQGTVDVSLRDVPWDQALDIILKANKLGYAVDDTVVRIAPLNVLSQEEEERSRFVEAQALAGELRVVTIPLSYARASELVPILTRSALSSRGEVQVDMRTNTLIVRDLPERLTAADELVASLDQPQPQVEIEARIVQTTRDFARAIGVQWGFNGRVDPALGNTTPLAFPNSGSVSGRSGGVQGSVLGDVDAERGVNLGVAGATSAIGIALGSINGAVNLDVVLSQLERTGQGRLLSTPRVSTQNNVEAEMTQGVQIPIQTVANNTVTVSFKDAALTLRVTPQITAANTIIMRVFLENASPDFSRAVNLIPPIDTQRAVTTVLVADGETTVIGGIYVSREQATQGRVPLLHRVPLLGWLFRRDEMSDESRELLIFITPRITRS